MLQILKNKVEAFFEMNIGVANFEEKVEAFFEMNIGVVEGGECGPSERGLFVTRTLDSLLASTSLL